MQRNQIRHNENEIERYKHDKRDLQQQIDRYRESGDNFSHSTRQQLHKMKKEKDTWLLEATEIRLRDSETQVSHRALWRVPCPNHCILGCTKGKIRASLRDRNPVSDSTTKERAMDTNQPRIVKLENEKKENEAKIGFIKDYERQIEVLRKSEQLWLVTPLVP